MGISKFAATYLVLSQCMRLLKQATKIEKLEIEIHTGAFQQKNLVRLFSMRPNLYFDKKGNNDTFMFILTTNICFTKFDEILEKMKILLVFF